MNDSPNCVCENMRIEFGMPASATSIGYVTCFSTSSAARPGIERDHRHLRIRHVRQRFHRQLLERDDAAADEENHPEKDEQRLLQREGDEPSNHRGVLALAHFWTRRGCSICCSIRRLR